MSYNQIYTREEGDLYNVNEKNTKDYIIYNIIYNFICNILIYINIKSLFFIVVIIFVLLSFFSIFFI